MKPLENEKVLEMLKRRKESGYKILGILDKQGKFIEALASGVGYMLLEDLMGREYDLLNKISDFKSTPEEQMEYKVIKTLLDTYSLKIKNYEITVEKINSGKI